MKAWFIMHERVLKKIAICIGIVALVFSVIAIIIAIVKPKVGKEVTLDGNTYVVTKSPLFGDGECTLLKSENEKIEVPNKINFGSRDCTVKYLLDDSVSDKSVVFPENFVGFAYYKNDEIITTEEIFTELNIKEITVSKDNKKYDSRENCNCIIETSTNTLLLSANTNVHIPNGVTKIGTNALYGYFDDFVGDEFILPEDIKVLDDYAFGDSSALIFGNGEFVTYVADYFDLGLVEYLGEKVFYMSVLGSFETNPAIVTMILPNTIKEMNSKALVASGTHNGENSSIKLNVYYKGSKEEFSQIKFIGGEKLEFNDNDSTTIYYYSSEKIEDGNNYWHYDSNNEIVIWE